MSEALTVLGEWLEADLTHIEPCTARPCSCGLWGLQRYLGLEKR